MWDSTDPGNRLIKMTNGLRPTAVSFSAHVFFINTDGFVVDIIQTTKGGPWQNGTLADQMYFIPQDIWADSLFSISAVFCHMREWPTVYVQATDLKIHAFQLWWMREAMKRHPGPS
jgi:hypothetical protein